MEGARHNSLNAILPELIDEAVAFGVVLQYVHGFLQIKFPGLPERGARPAAQSKDQNRIDPDDGAKGDGDGHRPLRSSTLTQRSPKPRHRNFNAQRKARMESTPGAGRSVSTKVGRCCSGRARR